MTDKTKAKKNQPADDIDEPPAADESADKTISTSEATGHAKATARSGGGLLARAKSFPGTYWRHKKLSLPCTVLAALLVILGVPLLRYDALGLFLKQTEQVTVVDSTTGSPVSGARLQIGGLSAVTSAKGVATFRVPVGYGTLTVSKQYYKSDSQKVLVSYAKAHNNVKLHLVATGRLVPIVVINKITGKPVSNAELSVLDTETKTDKTGHAVIALPVGKATQNGAVTANGFNKGEVTVQVTSQAVPANTFVLTPTGSVYFLSNLSGNIDVVKTNLDGTDRKTVLAGTGNETPQSTVLLASRDWKYLALQAQRKASGNPELDLIDTSTDTMSNIDEGKATFTPVGWAGDRFIYEVSRNSVQPWQNGQRALKSFNAITKSITVLAQTSGIGDDFDWAGQTIDAYLVGTNQVVYSEVWSGNNDRLFVGKQDTLNAVGADGSNPAVVKSLTLTYGEYSPIAIRQYDGANNLAVQISTGSGPNIYYEYASGKLTVTTELNDQNFYNNNYPTYLISPSGKQTFWSQPTDGKNNLFVGDQDGQNGKNIALLSDYSPYGWFTDNYLLVSKNSSELYIMPTSGGTPQKISDYFKPSQFFRGYGGGYGGL